MRTQILRGLFGRLGNTAVKWAACLLATVSISSAWGAAQIGDTPYATLAEAIRAYRACDHEFRKENMK